MWLHDTFAHIPPLSLSLSLSLFYHIVFTSLNLTHKSTQEYIDLRQRIQTA